MLAVPEGADKSVHIKYLLLEAVLPEGIVLLKSK
jgi:hypothetical protein